MVKLLTSSVFPLHLPAGGKSELWRETTGGEQDEEEMAGSVTLRASEGGASPRLKC